MRRPILIIVVLASVVACRVGRRAETLPLAKAPGGAMGTIDLERGNRIEGELLAVDDSALIVLRGQTMVVVPWSNLRQALFPQMQYAMRSRGQSPDAATLRSLRLISHFPQGISAELRPKLAAMYGTDSVTK